MVSAYLGELWAINRLRIQLYDKGETDKAKELFEIAAYYGHWGYYNLAKRFYSKDPAEYKSLLEKAFKRGNKLAGEELEKIE